MILGAITPRVTSADLGLTLDSVGERAVDALRLGHDYVGTEHEVKLLAHLSA